MLKEATMPWEKQFDKGEVLAKVLDAFWQRGYEATSMQDLVDHTGVNRGSLYATYGDKRALFMASLERYDDNRRNMLAALEKRADPRDAIRDVFMAFARDLSKTNGNRGCFITNTALELSAHDGRIRKFVSEAQIDVEAFFERMVRKGQVGGQFAKDLLPDRAAKGLLASMLGFVVLVRSRPDPILLNAIVDGAIRALE
jgi:TetR/AcrR family transcriptional regulator, transcriptional repressor for nem operon